VVLSWVTSLGATGYNVKRSTTTGGPYAAVATNVAGTSYTNVGLAVGTSYYYVVSAVNPAGESTNSSQVSAIPGVLDRAGWVASASGAMAPGRRQTRLTAISTPGGQQELPR